jgi:hypothetical protein
MATCAPFSWAHNAFISTEIGHAQPMNNACTTHTQQSQKTRKLYFWQKPTVRVV